MTDFPSPTDIRNIGSSVGAPQKTFLGGPGVQQSMVPEVNTWIANWQQQNLGRQIEPDDADLINAISKTFLSRPLLPAPVQRPPELNHFTQLPDTIGFDPKLAFKHGFESSFIGALQRFTAVDGAAHLKSDPNYNIFADKQIEESPFKGQWHLFDTSRSAEETAWLINYMRRHEKEAGILQRMTGSPDIFTTAGGLMGDPLNFIPATLGFKGVQIAQRNRLLMSPENIALGFKPVVLGGVADGLRAGSAQAAIALADAGFHRVLDPTQETGSLSDTVALPAAIAASIGFVVGAYGRYQVGMDALRMSTANEAFLAGTRARARNLTVGEGPAAPGVLSDAERRAWERATAANPDGRFHVDGMVLGVEGDLVHFRTAEGLDTTVPLKEVDQISEKASRGIVVSSKAMLADDALKGSGMNLDGQFLGGGRPRIKSQVEIGPGSLATDYPAMRAKEISDVGEIVYLGNWGAPLPRGWVDTGERLVDKTFKPGELPRADAPKITVEQLRAEPGLTQVRPRQLVPNNDGRMDAHVITADGRIWKISPDFGLTDIEKEKLSPDFGHHAVFYARYGELHPETIRLTSYGDSIAADIPTYGRTPQQEATLHAIKSVWEKEGAGSKVLLGLDPESMAESQAKAARRAAELNPASGVDPLNPQGVEIAKGGGSLSAGGAGGTAVSRGAQLAGNKMVPTGIKLEELPFDVMTRAAKLPFTTWQTTVGDLLSTGGRLHMRNTAAFGHTPNAMPVETLVNVNWKRPTLEVVREMRDQWQAYRSAGQVSDSDTGRIWFETKTTAADAIDNLRGRPSNQLSFENFRRRVGDALINNDRDFITDAATPQVQAAATKVRGLLDKIGKEADDLGVFKAAHQQQLDKLKAALHETKKTGTPDQIAAAEARVVRAEQALHDVINQGPGVTTASSYRPRIWLHDQLIERADEFKQIVNDWLRLKNPNLSDNARKAAATEIHETLLRDKPIYTKDDLDKHFKELSEPGGAKARTFEIPDRLVKDFLENDAEAIVRSHSRQMGTAIEMHRRFGSTGLEDQVAELRHEFDLLMLAAPDNAAKRELIKQHKLAEADLLASRDRLYGVYGAPEDPHRWNSRAIRMAKQFTNLTTLGMSGITAMSDLIRPLMTEGLQAVHDYGFRTLMSESRATILKMNRKELELAGDGMELILNTRALSMSDAGDMYRSRTPFERGLAKANSWFFVMNGLNFMNQIDKEWASVIIQGKANAEMVRLFRGGGNYTLDKARATRLAAAGIDEEMARRIGRELSSKGGSNRFGKLILADTENWVDEEAAKAYRVALNQMVNRTIPTPTLADTPNWMSTELGTLMTQYKSFAFGAMNRTLVAGLQEEGRKFWYGAAAAVGFGMLLNEIRSRLFYDRSTFDKPATAVIMDAVDRSSILGYFSDANRSIEVLTGHRAGIRPMLGGSRPHDESGSRVVGALAGPAAGQAANAWSVLGDFLAMHPTARTFADARQLVPGQNLPYLDPVMDRLISDGRRWPEKKKKRGE